MKKVISILGLSVFGMFFSLKAKADLIITNYTPIQYNIVLSDGSYIGISATNPATYTYPGYFSWTISHARIYPHTSWPIITVGDWSVFPGTVIYPLVVPPMTTPFTAVYMPIGANVYLSFYP